MTEAVALQLREARQALYAMRNGIVADALRRAGAPFRLIYGVNLPQLADIASRIIPSRDLAEELWHSSHHREAMLLATMVYPPDELSEERAVEMTAECTWTETADLLTMKLLRLTPFAASLARTLTAYPDPMQRYCGMRLIYFRLADDPDGAVAAAREELARAEPLTAPIARRVIEEADFMRE